MLQLRVGDYIMNFLEVVSIFEHNTGFERETVADKTGTETISYLNISNCKITVNEDELFENIIRVFFEADENDIYLNITHSKADNYTSFKITAINSLVIE